MNEREKARALLDQVPEGKLFYVISFLQGTIVPDETPNAETLESFAEMENGGGIRFPGTTTSEFLNKLLED